MMIDPALDLARDPGAVRVQKLPVPVTVQWMAHDGACQTLEGTVHFRAGDPVLTGVEGEQWTMPAQTFSASYEAVPPLPAGDDGLYRKKPRVVRAVRLAQPADVRVSFQDSLLHGEPGDWLVQYGPGDFGIVAASIFGKTYQVMDESAG
jgi:hypothetical protein